MLYLGRSSVAFLQTDMGLDVKRGDGSVVSCDMLIPQKFTGISLLLSCVLRIFWF